MSESKDTKDNKDIKETKDQSQIPKLVVAETKVEAVATATETPDTFSIKASAQPVIVVNTQDKANLIPDQVKLEHLSQNLQYPFNDPDTLKFLKKLHEESLLTGKPVTKIKKVSGKDPKTLTQAEKDKKLKFSVIFVEDAQGKISPITLYFGKTFLLGEGTFGKVKIGYDEDKGEWVAVKVQKFMKSDPKFAQNLQMARDEKKVGEARGIYELSRGYLEREQAEYVKLYSVQNILGKELWGLLAANVPSHLLPANAPKYLSKDSINTPSERLDIAVQMAQRIQESHAKNMLHRDIKPENFLYDKKGKKVTLIDWAFGVNLGDKSSILIPGKGTMIYLAPELAKPHFVQGVRCSEYAKPSDVYALGITLQQVFGLHRDICIILQRRKMLFPDFPGLEKLPETIKQKMIILILNMVSGVPEHRKDISQVVEELQKLKNEYEKTTKVEVEQKQEGAQMPSTTGQFDAERKRRASEEVKERKGDDTLKPS